MGVTMDQDQSRRDLAELIIMEMTGELAQIQKDPVVKAFKDAGFEPGEAVAYIKGFAAAKGWGLK